MEVGQTTVGGVVLVCMKWKVEQEIVLYRKTVTIGVKKAINKYAQ